MRSPVAIVDTSIFPELQVMNPGDLVRLGGQNDGGYVISQASLMNSDSLLSFGNGYNVDFEFDLLSQNSFGLESLIFDGTINLLSLRQFLLSALNSIKFFSWRPMMVYFGFLKKATVLRLKGTRFIKKNVSFNPNKRELSLTQCINLLSHKSMIILKIDIEGNEYELMDEIIENLHKIQCLIIEFHNLEDNFNLFGRFLRRIRQCNYNLDHIHGNNYSGFTTFGFPNVVEVSISRTLPKLCYTKVISLPTPGLDSPCSSVRPEIAFEFR